MALSSAATMSALPYLPERRSLRQLRDAVQVCRGCQLYRNATQAVFGAGTASAHMMLVGETPGDAEDRAGKPFVGPAGRLLDELLEEAGIPRGEVYVTNAVKHFKWEPGGGVRRLHAKPSAREISACRPWLEAELDAIRPDVIVCLGATAAQALLGRGFRVTRQRGEVVASDWAMRGVVATYHPSAALRAPDSESRARMRSEMLADFKTAKSVLNP